MLEFAMEQALFRLPERSREYGELEKQLNNVRAGADGERKVLETIRSVSLPEDCCIIENLNLPLLGGLQFQIDFALIARSGILLLVTKQIGGRLRFHQGPAELRKVDDTGRIIQTFDCPVTQLHDQIGNLNDWLELLDLRTNIQGFVVFANNPVIEAIPAAMPVVKLRELRVQIRSHINKPAVIDNEKVLSIANSLRHHSKPYLPFPYSEHYKMNSVLLYRGMLCNRCGSYLKKRTERSWECESCRMISHKPHLEMLLTWFLLISSTITPQQCLSLFNYQSHKSARKLIMQLPVTRIGSGGYIGFRADYAEFHRSATVQSIIDEWRSHGTQRMNKQESKQNMRKTKQSN
ncbi:hypothetical protein AV656_01535 [Bhargavaea cecembensis]|uniref:NERD domain-containing protein n=1 Tax=Bhargavaea cecembensis TaxID=394098 RepID=A0A163GBC8_9BACL|nr:nuclease-related domain-containing protein [Bhargavaea cecembensis]KZE39987.1 hypothetical protein AV656_01535 [Bhargavaea cecembensis]